MLWHLKLTLAKPGFIEGFESLLGAGSPFNSGLFMFYV